MFKHRIKATFRRTAGFAKKHRGEILYYAGVMLLLSAIAWGAEQYRIRREDAPPVLPAAQIVEAAPRKMDFVLPESMTLLQGFSDQPRWNDQDQCWQAHPAADYSCEGGAVYALSAGTVITVGESGVLGGFAELQSGDVLLKYCSIELQDGIAPGAQIKMGQRIGTARDAVPGERSLGSHLHLEVYRQGAAMDPQELLENAD